MQSIDKPISRNYQPHTCTPKPQHNAYYWTHVPAVPHAAMQKRIVACLLLLFAVQYMCLEWTEQLHALTITLLQSICSATFHGGYHPLFLRAPQFAASVACAHHSLLASHLLSPTSCLSPLASHHSPAVRVSMNTRSRSPIKIHRIIILAKKIHEAPTMIVFMKHNPYQTHSYAFDKG